MPGMYAQISAPFPLWIGGFFYARWTQRRINGRQKEKGGGMELKDFVRDTITQIADGILEAQEKAKGEDGKYRYLPSPVQYYSEKEKNTPQQRNGEMVEKIEFDVAVTTNFSAQGEGEAKIYVAEASLSGELEHSKMARIKFHVFVQWPHCSK